MDIKRVLLMFIRVAKFFISQIEEELKKCDDQKKHERRIAISK